MSGISKASFLISSGRYDLAATELRGALTQEPEDVVVLALLAFCLGQLGNYQEALQTARLAYSKNSWEPYPCIALYTLLRQTPSAHDERIACLERALEISPDDAETWGLLAIEWSESGRMLESRQACLKGLALDADSTVCNDCLAIHQTFGSAATEKVDAVKHSLESDPENVVSLCLLGWQKLKAGERAEALVCFEQALAIDPESPSGHHGWSYVKSLKP